MSSEHASERRYVSLSTELQRCIGKIYPLSLELLAIENASNHQNINYVSRKNASSDGGRYVTMNGGLAY